MKKQLILKWNTFTSMVHYISYLMQVMHHLCWKHTVLLKHQYIRPFLIQIKEYVNHNNTLHAFIEPNLSMISSKSVFSVSSLSMLKAIIQDHSIILRKRPVTNVKTFQGPVTPIKSWKCDMSCIFLTKKHNMRI